MNTTDHSSASREKGVHCVLSNRVRRYAGNTNALLGLATKAYTQPLASAHLIFISLFMVLEVQEITCDENNFPMPMAFRFNFFYRRPCVRS